MGDLIKELWLFGYGTHLSNVFIGSILYADDICLISHSCFGLQKMLDIRYIYMVLQGGSVAEWLACWTQAQ